MSERVIIDDSEMEEEFKFLESLGPLASKLTYWDETLQRYTEPPQKFDPAKDTFVPTEK